MVFGNNPGDFLASLPPSLQERMKFMSASDVLVALVKQLEKWQKKEKEGEQLAVMMTLPDGRVMNVTEIAPNGFNTFFATGYVEGMLMMMTGHISTLSVFCAYEQVGKGARRAGFTITTTPPAESEPQATEPPAPAAEP